MNIEVRGRNLILKINKKGKFSSDEMVKIIKETKDKSSCQEFNKFEIDFKGSFFNLRELLEKLIIQTRLFRDKRMLYHVNFKKRYKSCLKKSYYV